MYSYEYNYYSLKEGVNGQSYSLHDQWANECRARSWKPRLPGYTNGARIHFLNSVRLFSKPKPPDGNQAPSWLRGYQTSPSTHRFHRLQEEVTESTFSPNAYPRSLNCQSLMNLLQLVYAH